MAENYVEIKIKASDTAKPDLTALRADLDELGTKIETAKVNVDDKDSAAKLLALNAKLAQLNRQVASPRITVAGAARAEAQIAAVDAELEKLNESTEKFKEKAKEAAEHAKELADKAKELGDKAEETSGSVGGLGRALAKLTEIGSGGGGGSGGGLLSKILYGAEGLEGGGEGGITGLLGELGPALLGIVPAIEAGAVEATGLASGFAAAGAGAGAFALLAMPAFSKVKTALSSISTDQKAYDDALTKTAKNTALKKLQQDYKSLSPDERGAVKGIQSLQTEFGKISKAFEPEAFKVFNDALKIANNLLPVVAPLATSFANALDGLLKKVDKFTSSKGFKDWLTQFEKLSGPSVTAIGDGIGKVAVQVGKLLTVMSKKDVVHSINIAFDILAGAIGAVTYMVRTLMSNWDHLSSAFRRTRHDIASAGHDIASVFDRMRHDAADLAHNVAAHFDELRHDVAHAIDEVREAIVHGAQAALSWVKSHWKEIVAWFVDPVGMIVMEIRQHTHQIAKAFDAARHAVAAAIDGTVHDIASAFDRIRHDIASLAADVPKLIKKGFEDARHNANASAKGAQHDLESIWDRMRHDVASFIDDVVSFFKSLPGKILAELKALPGQMLTAGENIIKGLINGIKNAAEAIPGVMKSLAGDVESYFTDPLKMFSPSRVFIQHGQNIVQGAVIGVQGSAPKLRQAMQQLGRQVAGTSLGGGSLAGAGGAGGTQRLQLEFVGGDDPIIRAFRQSIRVRGGNVQAVLGAGR